MSTTVPRGENRPIRHRTVNPARIVVEDPAGNPWTVHTVFENLSAEAIYSRSAGVVGRKSN